MKCNALCVVESCKQCAVCGVPACETQRVFVLYHGERQERHNAHLHTHPCMPLSRLSPVPCPEVDSGSKGNIDAHFSKCLYYLHSMNITTRKKSKWCRLGVRGRRWRPGSQDSVLLLLSSCSVTSITEKHLNPELFLERIFFLLRESRQIWRPNFGEIIDQDRESMDTPGPKAKTKRRDIWVQYHWEWLAPCVASIIPLLYLPITRASTPIRFFPHTVAYLCPRYSGYLGEGQPQAACPVSMSPS